MTAESALWSGPADRQGRTSRWQSWRSSAALIRAADVLAALIAASLPWSTTVPSIFVGLWLLVVTPTIDWRDYGHKVARPAFALPFAILLLALLGLLWSDGAWADRLHAIKPVAKLVLIPPLLYHFSRSERGLWVGHAFVVSCALLAVFSWIVWLDPAWKITATASSGVPVKNYIDQSQEFTLCAFALALPALTFWRRGNAVATAACLALILLFAANMVFVASARTALLCIAVLLALFAWKHLNRRATLVLLAGTVAVTALAWATSPYLRQRITDIAVEYRHGYEDISRASTAQRLTYWRKAIHSFAEAPLTGHGTGSIRRQFERAATGGSSLDAEVVNNPHNQTLNVAMQWGLLGVVLLYAMWIVHLRLFLGGGLAAWIGLVVVVQNITSSLLNSHLFDFHEGWMYVLGVGVAGGTVLKAKARSQP
ncbi:O-antigen ligase family protein [Bradyrhizobium sp. 62B]|uniref:O-antigen ligase family protein n=1 Tax=unclassified Bradyrhizobium TaxID=2631580 RepID=UPI001BA743C2|nr:MULTISPECIES: O-antigen ligase family protein [Bradyrhizobium]MBR0927489.1 O-antigen ligase family protein [Bradyrhizobium diazoefficiens]MDT4741187.1 O-antigen ligase family protein [Bradyrhizobium sp. WYCCWR 12699]WIW43313.1 O-antigen ligase family protein [Bradyrhizobium sp. 62B]